MDTGCDVEIAFLTIKAAEPQSPPAIYAPVSPKRDFGLTGDLNKRKLTLFMVLAMGLMSFTASFSSSSSSFLWYLVFHACVGFWGGASGVFSWNDEVVGMCLFGIITLPTFYLVQSFVRHYFPFYCFLFAVSSHLIAGFLGGLWQTRN
eukprot:TRINITY_DN4331_c0_g3_i5.p1 TRINITY_DN4331_c0_g3~~TRINITY_DN4331_c0_g3_i5.p1  ORF type:complete len:148 (-),score=12.18 TRINITY_DN4331_c0_g3_i5:193-636(-)